MTEDRPASTTGENAHIAEIMHRYGRVELHEIAGTDQASVNLVLADNAQDSRTMFTGASDMAALVLARLAVRFPHLKTNLPTSNTAKPKRHRGSRWPVSHPKT